MLIFLLLLNSVISELIPHIVPLDINQEDIQDISLSNEGIYICVTTFGGDAHLLYNNGRLMLTFERNKSIGEYIISCSFSPKTAFMVINSVIQNTWFYGIAYLKVYNIGIPDPIVIEQTTLRNWQEFPWPSVYVFSGGDDKLAIASYNSNVVIMYDFYKETKIEITANTNTISTMLFSNDVQFLIWKETKAGNITIYDLNLNVVHKVFSVSNDTIDVGYYKNPSVIISKNGKYMIDGSSNTYNLYVINTESGNSTRISGYPWYGQTMSFQDNAYLYIRPFEKILVSQNMETGNKINIMNATNYKIASDYIVIANDNEMIVCKLHNINNCERGSWNASLQHIGYYGTIDVNNNLVVWKKV